jgi:hypothetical protein
MAAEAPPAKSIYQRLSIREIKARPTAGLETDDGTPKQEGYHSSDAIIGFTGYLPGLQNNIGCSFPTQAKMSRSYTEQQQTTLKAHGHQHKTGQAAQPETVKDGFDRWGNVKMTNTLAKSLAKEYQTALGSESIDVAAVSPSVAAPQILPKTEAAARPGMPKHVLGYTGYRKGASDHFGEPFSRVEAEVVGASGTTYEKLNQSPARKAA